MVSPAEKNWWDDSRVGGTLDNLRSGIKREMVVSNR